MSMKVYEYANCGTCKKALKFLDKNGATYQKISITEQPPSMNELKEMLGHLQARGLSYKNLFNTSGVQYRELGISQMIQDGLSETQALQMLAQNGKLIKRPFLLTKNSGTVGFQEQEWISILKKK